MTFDQYIALMRQEADRVLDATADELVRHQHAFSGINLQRTARILRTYAPSSELREIVAAVSEPQHWMVLTEPWCGDSAQNVPYLATIASLNPRILLRLFRRDLHPDVMERYLTNGTRSIPKLVAYNAEGGELFRWGPRPQEAQQVFQQGSEAGLTKEQRLEQLHFWYGRNKGKNLEAELLRLIRQTVD